MFFGEIYDSIRGRIDCRQKIKPKSDRLLVLLSQKAAGGGLENQIVEAIHEPARGLRWAWLMTVDRGLRGMSRGWQA
jgi:hypothetical protein